MPRVNAPPVPKLNVEEFDKKHLEGNTKPGTRIEVRNLSRATQDVMVEADARGHFDAPLTSRKGDTLEVHLERPEGSVNVYLRNEGPNAWSRVAPPLNEAEMDLMDVDLPMLEPTEEHLDDVHNALVEVHAVEGPLFVNGVAAEDVLQGKINNCYLACGLSLLAHYRPEAIQDAIQVLPNGHFEVTLYEGKYRPEPVTITVDSNLFVDEEGEPIYTHSSTGELWPMILEKAYADFKGGSYEKIGQGGKAGDVIRAFTGEPYMMHQVADARSLEDIFETVSNAVNSGLPASAGTYGDKDRYEGIKLYANHNYAVLGAGYDETTNEPYLLLRNPWGQSEPDYHGKPDGKDDGIFKISMEDFDRYFLTYSVVTEGRGRRGR